MKPIPPFIPNTDDDIHCVNAVYRMVFKFYLDQDYSWDQIDALTKSIPGKGTWTVPGNIELAKQGVQVANIEPVDYAQLYTQGPEYLRQVVGEKTAKYYFERTNIAHIIPLIPEFLQTVSHETRRSTLAEVIDYLKAGKLVAAEVNSSVLNHSSGFALHFVLLYDFDGTFLYLHDPGLPPVPSRRLTVEEFVACWSYKGSNGGIEVFEKK